LGRLYPAQSDRDEPGGSATPIGLAAALEYYRHGNVDVRAAVILATMMMIGAWAGAYVANRIRGPHLRLAFGVFVCGLGIYLVYGACKRLGWL